jgi:hypothetical protein
VNLVHAVHARESPVDVTVRLHERGGVGKLLRFVGSKPQQLGGNVERIGPVARDALYLLPAQSFSEE